MSLAERSRSRNSSGGPSTRRTCSSPPTSRRGTDSFGCSEETPFGLSKNILDRYKDMQSLTKSPYTNPAPEDCIDGRDPLKTGKEMGLMKAADSVKSLDFESVLHEKVGNSILLSQY